MKINWKVRFRNKTWLSMFLSLVVGFVFNILKLFDGEIKQPERYQHSGRPGDTNALQISNYSIRCFRDVCQAVNRCAQAACKYQ